MALDVEPIQAALEARLISILGSKILFHTRQDVVFDDIPKIKQPAMRLLHEGGTGHRAPGCSTMWTLHSVVTFFVRDPTDKKQTAEPQLHELLRLLDTALARQPNEPFSEDDPGTTLGGLVFECWRSEYQHHHGMQQGQSAVSCTIEMKRNE